jgi:hypothetical protein
MLGIAASTRTADAEDALGRLEAGGRCEPEETLGVAASARTPETEDTRGRLGATAKLGRAASAGTVGRFGTGACGERLETE